MKRNTFTALMTAAAFMATPAYAHHEYSSNNGLLSLATGSPLAILAFGLAGLIAARLIVRRNSR
ncbi:MAG: hypothetical protein AAF683_11725 [Pseudomonadota bacterium]